MRLLAELKRRNVIRMAGLYLVGAWLLIQVAETLLPIFHTPDWVLQALVVLLALGFLPALVFSWVFELTPEGLKRDSEVTPEHSIAPQTGRRMDTLIVAGLLAVIAVVAADRYWPRSAPATDAVADAAAPAVGVQAPTTPAQKSIAVLAFADLSPDKDQEYFADGIAEELLNLLARIDGLQVAARTSSFKFKGTAADIGEIGRALGVQAVLEGSVRKAGDQVRITAQLIKVEDGFHLWTRSYDRRLENLFAVQDEIATAIVEALKLELDLAAETAGRTANLAAYDLYLRGRHLAQAPSRDGLLQAVALFEQALDLDPDFAAAYGGIADAWVWLEDYGGFRSADAFPKAEFAARRALALDPASAEANAAMARVQQSYYNDLAQARLLFERTLTISPNYVMAYNNYAITLRDLGEPRRMVEVQRRAVELDPLSTYLRAQLAVHLSSAGDTDGAARMLETILAESPDDDYALEALAYLHLRLDRVAESAAAYRHVHNARPGDPYPAAWLASIGAQLEHAGMADAWTTAARERGADNRWELMAREALALWRGDWPSLDAVGNSLGGQHGAYLRARAALGEQRAVDARRALNESLRLGGYRVGQALNGDNIGALLVLAWLDRNEGQAGWQARADEVRQYLQRVAAEGGIYDGRINTNTRLAQLAALTGDRDASLELMKQGIAGGFRDHWFLDRDALFSAWRDDPEFRAPVAQLRERAAGHRTRIVAAGLERPRAP